MRNLGAWTITAVAGWALGAPAAAQSTADLAARFGALETVQYISLSPDGQKVAIISPVQGTSVLLIADLVVGGLPKPVLRAGPSDGRISSCRWSTDTRLVCRLRYVGNDAGRIVPLSRLFAVNSDGSKVVQLTTEANSRSLYDVYNSGAVIDWDVPGRPGAVLMTRQYIPEKTIGTRLASEEQGLGVDEVDTLTLKRRRAEGPNRIAAGYITDGHGTVRIMSTWENQRNGYLNDQLRYLFRRPGSNKWEHLSTISTIDDTAGGFNPVAVDRAANVAYGFDKKDGFTALYKLSLDGAGTKEVVLARNDVDVDSLETIGRDERVVGASYATERRMVEYFDPELRKLGASLSRALPGNPAIGFVDSSADEKRLLISVSSDINPGKFYIYDKANNQLEELLPVREALAGMTLAEMKPIAFPAADGSMIPGYLTLPPGSSGKNLPAIVMPHGGPSARDEWGFDWLVQFYAARGFAVLQPNFRGSSGYGDAWYQKNGFKSWRIAVGDVNDAGRWLQAQGIAAPGKLAVVGWSYGGYAALQSPALDSGLYKAIVAIAPVTDLEKLRQEAADYANFPQVDAFIGSGPHVKDGSPAENVDKIVAPVLLYHGDIDTNVAISQSRLMAARLKSAGKQVELVEFSGHDHQLGSAGARTKMLAGSDAFLRKSLGLPSD